MPPACRRTTQMSLSVAVNWLFLERPARSYKRRVGWRSRNALRPGAMKRSAKRYVVVRVVSFSAWSRPLNSAPRSEKYSARPSRQRKLVGELVLGVHRSAIRVLRRRVLEKTLDHIIAFQRKGGVQALHARSHNCRRYEVFPWAHPGSVGTELPAVWAGPVPAPG